jgi:phage-related protein
MENKGIYRVLFYENRRGDCPAEELLSSLYVKVRAKAAKWIGKLEEFGPDLPRPYADSVRGKVRELRIIFASHQYRFLYFFFHRYIVITHGFIKKTDEIPENEIVRAEKAMVDFEDRVQKGEIKL